MVKNPPANAGNAGFIPGSRRSPGGGNGSSLQYSCLENPMDRGAWGATVHGVTEKTERLTLSFPSSVLAWETPWTEVPRTLGLGRLQSLVRKSRT